MPLSSAWRSTALLSPSPGVPSAHATCTSGEEEGRSGVGGDTDLAGFQQEVGIYRP